MPGCQVGDCKDMENERGEIDAHCHWGSWKCVKKRG